MHFCPLFWQIGCYRSICTKYQTISLENHFILVINISLRKQSLVFDLVLLVYQNFTQCTEKNKGSVIFRLRSITFSNKRNTVAIIRTTKTVLRPLETCTPLIRNFSRVGGQHFSCFANRRVQFCSNCANGRFNF